MPAPTTPSHSLSDSCCHEPQPSSEQAPPSPQQIRGWQLRPPRLWPSGRTAAPLPLQPLRARHRSGTISTDGSTSDLDAYGSPLALSTDGRRHSFTLGTSQPSERTAALPPSASTAAPPPSAWLCLWHGSKAPPSAPTAAHLSSAQTAAPQS